MAYAPLDEKVIDDHLRGRDNLVAGIYPLCLDETCYFLAIDFDDGGSGTDSQVSYGGNTGVQLPKMRSNDRPLNAELPLMAETLPDWPDDAIRPTLRTPMEKRLKAPVRLNRPLIPFHKRLRKSFHTARQ